MGSWWVVLSGSTVAFLAVAFAVYATERLNRSVLFALLSGAILLDLLVARSGLDRPGLGNALVVAVAVPLGVWIASLIRERQGLIAVLVTAAVFDLAGSFATPATISAIPSSVGNPARLLAICVPFDGQRVSPLSLTDLTILALVLSSAARFEVRRIHAGLLCLVGLVVALVLEQMLGAEVARVPFFAACGVLAISSGVGRAP